MSQIASHSDSKIIIVENSDEMLQIQTRCETPAAGLVGLLTLLLISTIGLISIYEYIQVYFWSGLSVLLMALFGFWSAMATIVDGFGWDNLKLSKSEIQFDRHFGPISLRTYRAPIDEITGLKLIDRKFYCLKIRTKRWSALFGFEDRPAMLESIRSEIERRIETAH